MRGTSPLLRDPTPRLLPLRRVLKGIFPLLYGMQLVQLVLTICLSLSVFGQNISIPSIWKACIIRLHSTYAVQPVVEHNQLLHARRAYCDDAKQNRPVHQCGTTWINEKSHQQEWFDLIYFLRTIVVLNTSHSCEGCGYGYTTVSIDHVVCHCP
jgi:hypothetical protein